MDSRRAGGIALFGIATLVIIWVLLSLMPKVASAPQMASTKDSTTVPASGGPQLTVHYTKTGSMYSYEGSIDLPTPCTQLSVGTSVSYTTATTSSVTLALTTTASKQACVQQITPQKFAASVSSKQMPQFRMTADGTPVRVQLVEK